MSQSRMQLLRNEHRWLERRVQEEQRAPAPDSLGLQALKRRKMAIRDEIALLENGLVPLRF